MTLAVARAGARRTLAGALGKAFSRGHSYRPSCSRVSSTRFSCGFTFFSGSNDYYGTVIVFYTSGSGDKAYWSDSYTVHWVSASCLRTGHRGSCKIHTKRGTW